MEAAEGRAEDAICGVAGIGASAGGLDAFTRFLKQLPADTGIAYVLVQHLDPRHESILADLLGPHTKMPVTQATQGLRVKPDRVYIIPPNSRMEIRDGVLQLTPRGEDKSRYLPIDYFLCSLAEDQKNCAFGVIFSGTASDGTIGMKAIRNEGGITFAQDETAKYAGMPRNAIAAGAIDFVLSPEGIAKEIARISRSPWPVQDGEAAARVEDFALAKIFVLLRSRTGVDFTHYKKPTIQRRLARRMTLRNAEGTEAYIALLRSDPNEIGALFDDLLINVTEFFREPESFELLAAKVFPALLRNRAAEDPVRIWVAACSTGEEVYSIAICLFEYFEKTGKSLPVQIFGTDLSERSVTTARVGRYSDVILSTVSPERLNRFFVRQENGHYQISRTIRDLCIFSRQDLTKDPPLSRMDLVSCRNLLIYLAPILQRRVLSLFSYALQPDGVLFLGNSESLGTLAEHFIPIDRDHKLYTRNSRFAVPTPETFHWGSPRNETDAPPPKPEDCLNILDREADRLVLHEFAPAGLVVNSTNQVVRFRGNVSQYLAVPAGPATLEVFKVVREDLALSVRSALQEAMVKDAPSRRDNVRIEAGNVSGEINIIVRPMGTVSAERHFLILFEETPSFGPHEKNGARRARPDVGEELAGELESTRAYLQSLIEELRTANEETQSANEELQSTNEELQTAKEELQSSNEELTTTNDEMKSRNDDLHRANSDLVNLLGSLQTTIAMLDRDLRIRRFTPLAEQTLNIIPSDSGRRLSDLKPRVEIPNLEPLLKSVIESRQPAEREVRDLEGRWYSVRVNPYRSDDEKIEGVVLQLLDIDQLKRVSEASEHARMYAEAILATIREPLVVLDYELRVRTANRSFFDTFGATPEESFNRNFLEIAGGRWNLPSVVEMLRKIEAGTQLGMEDVEVDVSLPGTGWRTFQLNARAVRRDGGTGLILLALEDVTDRKRSAEARYRRLFETAKDGIVIMDAQEGVITELNAFMRELFGYSVEELRGRRFWETGPLAALPGGRETLEKLWAEEVVRFPDISLPAKDGRKVDVDIVGNLYLEGEKRVIQFNIRDITERKTFERQLQQSAKLESLGLLAGGVAHDFNNLLTGIMGNASLVLDHAASNSPDRDFLREIVRASQRAADLTRQMLAYSGRGRFVTKLGDFSEVVRDISSLVRSSIPKQVDLEMRLDPNLPPVSADMTQLQQLVMNLVINAAEAIPEGKPGSVTVTTQLERVDRDSARSDFLTGDIGPGAYISLEVADTGAGMDEATRAKIFDPFFTTKFTGRGLGLAAVLGIVKGHKGAIQVKSAPGRGTSFKVLLPPAEGEVPGAPVKALPSDLDGTGLVLVVDDEDVVARLAAAALEARGYKTLTAKNGVDAVEAVRDCGAELSLVILDLTMPVMGGEEALGRIKELRPDLPVILSSGYDESMALRHLRESDLSGFIQKPYTVEKILEAVKAAISKTKVRP